jgi:hypothetical protein
MLEAPALLAREPPTSPLQVERETEMLILLAMLAHKPPPLVMPPQVTVTSWPEGETEMMEGAVHPKRPELGKRQVRRRWRLFFLRSNIKFGPLLPEIVVGRRLLPQARKFRGICVSEIVVGARGASLPETGCGSSGIFVARLRRRRTADVLYE